MNQPKFKFGDKVKCKYWNMVFTVGRIDWGKKRNCYYYYHENGIGNSGEEYLELYKEPEKIKLYALQETSGKGMIVFYNKDEAPNRAFKRVPEFDIDYQSQNYSPNGMQDINSRARG